MVGKCFVRFLFCLGLDLVRSIYSRCNALTGGSRMRVASTEMFWF